MKLSNKVAVIPGGNRMSHIGALWPITLVGGPAFMVAILLLFIVLIRHPSKRA
jgi:hypothetical protein